MQEETPTEPEPETPEQPTEEKPKTHQRAGITTNKGHGQSKARRRQAKASRRKNRR